MQERIQKIIAGAGITSRRKAEKLILGGRVSVNERLVTELGMKADPARDRIRVDGQLLRPTGRGRRLSLLLYKPREVFSVLNEPDPARARRTVASLLRGVRERVYPVGGLDYHSSGLLLLTNDGELANSLMAQSSTIPRTYHVKLEQALGPEDLAKLARGLVIDGERTAPCRVSRIAAKEKPWYEVTVAGGQDHQIRRMFERIRQTVVKLKLVGIAFLTIRGLAPGQFRALTGAEVDRLRAGKAKGGMKSPAEGPSRR